MSIPNYISGAVVAAGGIAGYLRTGSETSLAVALAFAALIFFAAFKISQANSASKSLGINLAIGTTSIHFRPANLVVAIFPFIESVL
jgi:uncharacterized membrane protein (UPF0136 family)